MVGAYKTAPTRYLETEAWVPPLDLYFNKWLADFEARLYKKSLQIGLDLERTTLGYLIIAACNRVYYRFRKPKSRR